MAWRCELTGKTRQIGHRVSHSNRKTKRQFKPNLLNVTLLSDSLGRSVRLRISANALKTVDHRGGLDAFLLKAKDAELSPRALVSDELCRHRVQRRIAFFHHWSDDRAYSRGHCHAGKVRTERRLRRPASGHAARPPLFKSVRIALKESARRKTDIVRSIK